MNIRQAVALSLLVVTSIGGVSAASAEGLTRAQVRQQLIQAENNGSQFVTDTSYPDISPVFAAQVARMKHDKNSDFGGVKAQTTESGTANSAPTKLASSKASNSDTCVGPASFCTPYFGS